MAKVSLMRNGQGQGRVGLGQSGGRGHEEQSAGVRATRISDTPGTQNQTAMREVEENSTGMVGNAVTAKDPDPNEDPLIYALSGADAALFSVDADDAATPDMDEGGQITVKSTTKLDFETRITYRVTITATDSFSDSASIDVTITVTDADEAPDVTGDADKGICREGDPLGGDIQGGGPGRGGSKVEPERHSMTRRLHDCWRGAGVRKVAQL